MWLAGIVTVIGGNLTIFAVPVQLYALTQSSAYVGLSGVFALVPLIVFGLWGGAWADAMDRRLLLIITAIGLAAFVAAILYVVPRTSVLGAILMTGYLGGAVFAHVRVDEPIWPVPVLFGALTWGGLYLRNERLRCLIPLTNP